MTSKSFDPYEWFSYYYAKMGREEATKILLDPLIEVSSMVSIYILTRDCTYKHYSEHQN